MSRPPYSSDPLDLLHEVDIDAQVPPGAETRVWSRLGESVAALESAAALRGAKSSPATKAGTGRGPLQAAIARPSLSPLLAWATPAFLVGAAMGAWGYRAWRPVEVRTIYLERPHAASERPVSSGSEAATPVAESLAPVVAAEKETGGAPRAPAQSSLVRLSNERRLLDQARKSMSEGNWQKAREVLERHGQVYPQGALIEEREAMLVNALVSLGYYEQAKRRGAAFRARFPESLVLPSVNAALGAIPQESVQ